MVSPVTGSNLLSYYQGQAALALFGSASSGTSTSGASTSGAASTSARARSPDIAWAVKAITGICFVASLALISFVASQRFVFRTAA